MHFLWQCAQDLQFLVNHYQQQLFSATAYMLMDPATLCGLVFQSMQHSSLRYLFSSRTHLEENETLADVYSRAPNQGSPQPQPFSSVLCCPKSSAVERCPWLLLSRRGQRDADRNRGTKRSKLPCLKLGEQILQARKDSSPATRTVQERENSPGAARIKYVSGLKDPALWVLELKGHNV